jgi:Ca-activated chloride channel family protein
MRLIATCVLLTVACLLLVLTVIVGCSTSPHQVVSQSASAPAAGSSVRPMDKTRADGTLTANVLNQIVGGAAAYDPTTNILISGNSNNRGVTSGQTLGTGRSYGLPPMIEEQRRMSEGMGGAVPPRAAASDLIVSGQLAQQAPPQGQQIAPPRIITPLQDEELWIISKPASQQPQNVLAAPDDRDPGSGALLARVADKPEQIPVPLKHTDVKASIDGYIATVDVTQQYHNPFNEKIEAVYVFPLPQNAAVNEFVMTIGDRKIRGIIREREEAQQIYDAAKAQGYTASLLTQERPNVFTQSVANIEPGKEIDIDVKYFHTLTYVDGWYEWDFPMVVGPRFNPPYSTSGIGAVQVGGTGISGQKTEIQYLRPDQRSGHDISLAVQIDAGVKIEQIESVNHKIIKTVDDQMPPNAHGTASGRATVVLNPADSIPNKDFVLRYKVAGHTLKSGLVIQRDPSGNGGYFTLMLVPPASMQNLPRQPLEMVFTLDVSGSMTGQPIEQSRRAIQYALAHMNPQDTFQIVRFANDSETMTPNPVPATPQNIRRAQQFIQTMSAGGGTMMMEGIKKSLAFERDPQRLRFVAFLTDGFIGNETEILGAVHDNLKDSRIFSFGVGSAPNRYLLDHMARMGAGAAAYLSLNDNPDEVMAAYFERISHPAMTDVKIDFGLMQASDVFPSKIPDVFVGRPVILTGRFKGNGETTIHLKGRVAGEDRDIAIPVRFDQSASTHSGIAAVWARMKIADLADQSTYDMSQDFETPIKQVALDYSLMSQYTSFVAVDSSHKTEGDHGTTLAVPLPVPDGVRYDTTVQQRQGAPVVAGHE